MKNHIVFAFMIGYTFGFFAKYEELYPKLNKFMTIAFHKLSEDEKTIFAPVNYKKNIEKGREAIRHLAKVIIDLYQEEASSVKLTCHEQVELFNEFSNQIIHKRESIFSTEPIVVIDEESAIRRASQLLTEKQLNCLQYLPFKENPERAKEVLLFFAELVTIVLQTNDIYVGIPLEEFKVNFIQNRFTNLQALYS